MARTAKPDQIRKPMRVRTNPSGLMMDFAHLRTTTPLAHPVGTLENLATSLRIHRITLPATIRYRTERGPFHSSSLSTEASKSSSSAEANISTSRRDTAMPPARSCASSAGSTSAATFTAA